MDFVPVTYSREQKRRTRKLMLGWVGATSVAAAQFPILMATGVLLLSATEPWVFCTSMLGFLAGSMGLVMSITAPSDWREQRKRARNEGVRASVNEHYGLNLSAGQFAALNYPETDPGKEFKTFGSIKVQDQVDGANFLERTLYLTATGGELKLSESRDGKRFKELKPARPAVEGSTSSPRAALESPRSTIEAQATPLSVSI